MEPEFVFCFAYNSMENISRYLKRTGTQSHIFRQSHRGLARLHKSSGSLLGASRFLSFGFYAYELHLHGNKSSLSQDPALADRANVPAHQRQQLSEVLTRSAALDSWYRTIRMSLLQHSFILSANILSLMPKFAPVMTTTVSRSMAGRHSLMETFDVYTIDQKRLNAVPVLFSMIFLSSWSETTIGDA
jgi:hypothetical protein